MNNVGPRISKPTTIILEELPPVTEIYIIKKKSDENQKLRKTLFSAQDCRESKSRNDNELLRRTNEMMEITRNKRFPITIRPNNTVLGTYRPKENAFSSISKTCHL